MQLITLLYFLIATATAPSPVAARLPHPTPAPFPSLPAAIHWEDSADVWRRSLGAAKTGHAVASVALPPIKAAADFYELKFKYLRGIPAPKK